MRRTTNWFSISLGIFFIMSLGMSLKYLFHEGVENSKSLLAFDYRTRNIQNSETLLLVFFCVLVLHSSVKYMKNFSSLS